MTGYEGQTNDSSSLQRYAPHELPDNFHLSEYILPIRLTDATEDGGLFGMRF